VDRVRDQLLAGAGLASDQHRRARRRDLCDLLVHLSHRPAVADEVRQLVALLELQAQVDVLVEQPAPLRLGEPVGLHRLRGHRRDDLEEAHELLVIAVGLEHELDAQRADGGAAIHDRHAGEAECHPLQAATARGAVQEQWLTAHVGHDDRLRALYHAAHDPLAELVARVHAVGGDADPRLDHQLVSVGVTKHERRLHHVVVALEHLEHAEQGASQLVGGGERLRDVDQGLGAPELRDAIAPQQNARGRRWHVGTVGG
jgi:hypothetical protein